MIITGLLLLIVAAVFDIAALYTVGGLLVILGALVWIIGSFGKPIGPRPHYW